MQNTKNSTGYFHLKEIALWASSAALIIVSFCLFDRENYMTLAASLILNAKGHPIGQALMIIFSLLYGIISYSFRYYREMLTYLGMTMPLAVFSLISWIKHPYEGKKSEVKVNAIGKKETALMFLASAVVTFAFYFILAYFKTANIVPGTISVTTSFLAAHLTFRRSPFFALAYAANDVV